MEHDGHRLSRRRDSHRCEWRRTRRDQHGSEYRAAITTEARLYRAGELDGGRRRHGVSQYPHPRTRCKRQQQMIGTTGMHPGSRRKTNMRKTILYIAGLLLLSLSTSPGIAQADDDLRGLIEQLRIDDPAVRLKAVESIASMPDKAADAIPALTDLYLDDADENVRRRAR